MLRNLILSFAPPPTRYIFIVSAMRCGTTLLQHIVGQHDHVLSAGETKIEYRNADHLIDLEHHLFEYNSIPEKLKKRDNWVYLEKCLHERYLLSLNDIQAPTVRFIFILRDPHSALTSLMERKGWPYTESIESAAWYYENRPRRVVELASQLNNPKLAYFLTYEDFLQNTQKHLDGLTKFLRMKKPLTNTYRKQKWTAKLSLGDVSQNIQKQEIVSNKRNNLAEVPSDLLQQLKNTHEESCRELGGICKGQTC